MMAKCTYVSIVACVATLGKCSARFEPAVCMYALSQCRAAHRVVETEGVLEFCNLNFLQSSRQGISDARLNPAWGMSDSRVNAACDITKAVMQKPATHDANGRALEHNQLPEPQVLARNIKCIIAQVHNRQITCKC